MTDIDPQLQLYLAHRAALVEYASPIVGGRPQAEDVVQEAWLRFSGRRGEELQQPVGYLYRIVRNLALDLARRLGCEQPHDDPGILDQLVDESASPESRASDQAALQAIATALAELPERTQAAFRMHRLGGLSLQQIAHTLGISVGLAHQLVHQALRHCAQRLEQQ